MFSLYPSSEYSGRHPPPLCVTASLPLCHVVMCLHVLPIRCEWHSDAVRCWVQITLPDDIVRSKVFYLEPTSLEDAIEQIDLVRTRSPARVCPVQGTDVTNNCACHCGELGPDADSTHFFSFSPQLGHDGAMISV